MKRLAFAVLLGVPFVPPLAHAAPAIVQIGVGVCTFAPPQLPEPITYTPDEIDHKVKVSTDSARDTLTLTCKVSDERLNDTGSALVFGSKFDPADDGCDVVDPRLPPGSAPRPATIWHAVISPTGEAILTCVVVGP